MQLKFFTIPLFQEDDKEEEVNQFLRTVKVLEIKKELIQHENFGFFWVVCVTYLPHNTDGFSIKGRIMRKTDYKDVLSAQEFEIFSNLRKIRKEIANKDAVPPFAVFSDAELAEIVKLNPIDINGISKINGIGRKKVEKYACEMVTMLNDMQILQKDEEDRTP